MTKVFILVSDQTFKEFRHANSYDCVESSAAVPDQWQ